MTKKLKQIQVQMLRDRNEFGIFLVSADEVKLGEERDVFGHFKGKIIQVWNQIIEVEDK